MKRRRLLLVTAWLAVAGAAIFASTIVVAPAKAQPSSCPKAHPLPVPATPEKAPLILKSDDDAKIVMGFGDSRRPDAYFVPLTADARRLTPRDFVPEEGLDVQLGGTRYLRRDAAHWISLNDDGLKASVVPLSRHELALCLIVHPKGVGGLKPGRYTGTAVVVFGYDKVPLAAVPVELTFRASRWAGIGIALLAVLLGLAVKVLSEAAAAQRALGVDAKEALKAYASQLRFPVVLILAFVAGSLLFVQMYLGDPAWGASVADMAKLFAVCFVAQMSGSEAIEIVRRVAGDSPAIHPATTGNP